MVRRPTTIRMWWVAAAVALSVVGLFASFSSAIVAPAATASPARPTTTSSATVDQAAREHDQAVFDLLVLERKLATTERRLAEAESERERLAARLATAAADRDRAERDLTATRTRLTSRLRATYMLGGLGWLDYLAASADVTQFVSRATLLSRVLVAETRLAEQIDRARTGAAQAETSLREATAAQAGLVSEARALRGILEQARTDQARLATRLGERLAKAQADARAAQARMEAINRQAGAGSPPDAGGAGTSTGGADTGAGGTTSTTIRSTTPRTGRQLTVRATAYALPGTTATGVGVRYGIIAVDPRVIPLGTRLYVPGYGEGIAADTGGAVKGNRIDVWLPSEAQAEQWGVKTITITILD